MKRYSGVSKSLVFKWHMRFQDGYDEFGEQFGNKSYASVGNVKAATDVIYSGNRHSFRR